MAHKKQGNTYLHLVYSVKDTIKDTDEHTEVLDWVSSRMVLRAGSSDGGDTLLDYGCLYHLVTSLNSTL